MNINILGKNFLGFVVYVLLQILIFNNIGITSLEIIPMVFLLFILMLPVETPKWMVLVSAFLLGLIVDIFSDTPGLNSFSSVLIAFFRTILLQYLSPRGGYDAGTIPSVASMGTSWFLKYASTLVLIYQFAYYFIENFGFSDFWFIFLKVMIGSIFTFILIFISQYIVYRKYK